MHHRIAARPSGPPNYRAEVDRFLVMEGGEVLDVVVRVIGVPLAATLVWLETGMIGAPVWAILYLASYAASVTYMRRLGPVVSRHQRRCVEATILLTTLTFLWLPVWAVTQQERGLLLFGAGLIGAQLVHLLQRADTSRVIIAGNTGIVAVALLAAYVALWPQITDPLMRLGILSSWLALVVYFARSMLSARRRTLDRDQANTRAAQAEKISAIGRLAGGIAHDFNNILTTISGNLELFAVLADPVEREEVVAAAQLASQRAAGIVSQIMIFARQSPHNLSLTDANAPLRSLKMLTDHLIPRRIALTLHPLAPAALIRADVDHLTSALLNLIVNAVDAIPGPGRVRVSVLTHRTAEDIPVAGQRSLPPGAYVVYDVTDTGHGIPPEIASQVIEPFFTTKPVGRGTGLGLSMVFGLAEGLGGGLALTSAPTGTTVRIYIPVAGTVTEAAARAASSAGDPAAPKPRSGISA